MREGRNGIRWREVFSGSSVHGKGGRELIELGMI